MLVLRTSNLQGATIKPTVLKSSPWTLLSSRPIWGLNPGGRKKSPDAHALNAAIFFTPNRGKTIFGSIFQIWLVARFSEWQYWQENIYAFRLIKNISINPKSVEFRQCHAVPHSICFSVKDNERNLCQDLLTIENTDSDLKVHHRSPKRNIRVCMVNCGWIISKLLFVTVILYYCIHFHLATVEGLFFKPKYRANILCICFNFIAVLFLFLSSPWGSVYRFLHSIYEL